MSSLAALGSTRVLTTAQVGSSRVRSQPSRGPAWTVPDLFQRSRLLAGRSLRAFSRQELSAVPVSSRRQRPSCATLRAPALRAQGAGDSQLSTSSLEQQPATSSAELPSISSSSSSSSAASSWNVSPADSSDGEAQSVQIDLELPRRSLQVTFTCNLCGGRTERLVNPIAWERGMVIAQCASCQAWHKLADAANLVEEIRYTNSDDE